MAQRYPFVFVFLVTALLICSAYYLHSPFNLRADTEAKYLDSLDVYRAHVIEPPVRKSYGWLLTVVLPAYGQQAMLAVHADSAQLAPVMGDVLLAHTRITRPHAIYKGDFDYGNYLRQQHKVGIGYVRTEDWQVIGHIPVRTLRAYAATVQQRLAQRFADAGLHGQSLAFVSAITLGEKDELDSDLRQSFATAGAAHVLAVSGLHTGIIYLALVSLLTCFGMKRPLYEQRARRVLLALTIILTMWAYAFVTGLSPSVMRAVIVLTIVQVGWIFRRQSFSLNTLAAAACICLWIDPLSLFSVSFQLSFAAVLGILLFLSYFNSVWKVRSKFFMFLRDLVTVSLAATIGTLPVTLYYFGQVSHYFILANILILPVAYVLVLGGGVLLLFAHTAVGAWLAFVLQHLSAWLCDFVQWIEHLPHATLQLSVTPWMVVCLVAAIGFCFLRIYRKRLVWFVPAVASVALFCVLLVADTRQSASEQTLTIRGRTMYYNRGGVIERKFLDNSCTFFRFDGVDYVYAHGLSKRKQQALQQYCAEQGITFWQE